MSKEFEAAKISEIADRLNVPASWLDAIINFETGGTYDPLAQNPRSSAVGLIQVLDSTAQSVFGVSDSLTLAMTYSDFGDQMENVVYPYLKQYMPYANRQQLCMAVFYPKYRNVAPSTEFPAYVQNANPGIKTIQDYMNFVDARIVEGTLRVPKAVPVLAALAGTGIILYLMYR